MAIFRVFILSTVKYPSLISTAMVGITIQYFTSAPLLVSLGEEPILSIYVRYFLRLS